jgi:hypothetical protein
MIALNLAAMNSEELGSIIVYSGSAGGFKSFRPPPRIWESFVKIRQGDTPAVANFMFPQGMKDPGMCSLYASWNSFYRSKYTSADRLTARGEEVSQMKGSYVKQQTVTKLVVCG